MPTRPHPSSLIVTRRALLIAGAAAALLPTVSLAKTHGASSRSGEAPTTGGARPGPVGFAQPALHVGTRPREIASEQAQFDAQVETQAIVNGRMQNPSGPFIAAWYEGTGKLGEDNNIVVAGHLDYWDVPQAVFYHLGELKKGNVITVVGADGQTYRYAVDWKKNYKLAELDTAGIQEIVGPTATEKLTLITCGGPFDSNKGEYLERTVVRSSRRQ